MKAIAIGGVPATGKTTLVKTILSIMQPESMFKYGLLRGYLANDCSILGIYKKDEVFAGTDKLSMAVQKDFEAYINKNRTHILFEGDRLFTKNNLLTLSEHYQLKIILLQSDEQTLKNRHIERDDNQSERFIKSRNTKLANICSEKKLHKYIEYHNLQSLVDTKCLADDLSNFIKK
jgi:adenylate kinase